MTSEPIYITLDKLPVSTNAIWRTTGKRTYLSPRYTAWKRETGWAIKAQIGAKRIAGPYALQMNCVRPDKRKRDLSNTIKSMEDLLVSLNVVDDDSECQQIEMRWVEQGPPVWLALRPCKQWGVV